MFDDIFSLIDNWMSPNQELNFEDSTQNYSNNSHDLFNSNDDNSIISDNQLFNTEKSLIDSEDYFNDLINTDYDNSVINNYEEFNLEESQISSVDYSFHEENWDVSQFDGVGNPFEDANCWQQQNGQNSCAVVAQMGVLESITGVDLSENEVCEFAEANGWFDPQTGTNSAAVGNILNAVGVTTDSYYNADLNDITEALAKGDKVIVGLDANEIWQPVRDSNGNPIEQGDGGHAVWVTGIDQLPDGSVKLILNDSGIPDGQMKVVDAEDFINAWDDFGNQIVIAHNSQPSALV